MKELKSVNEHQAFKNEVKGKRNCTPEYSSSRLLSNKLIVETEIALV